MRNQNQNELRTVGSEIQMRTVPDSQKEESLCLKADECSNGDCREKCTVETRKVIQVTVVTNEVRVCCLQRKRSVRGIECPGTEDLRLGLPGIACVFLRENKAPCQLSVTEVEVCCRRHGKD